MDDILQRIIRQDTDPIPGYMLHDLKKIVSCSQQVSSHVSVFLLNELVKKKRKNDVYVKLKILLVIKHLCNERIPEFMNILLKNVTIIKSLQSYNSSYDILHGDELIHQVRKESEECLTLLYKNENSIPVMNDVKPPLQFYRYTDKKNSYSQQKVIRNSDTHMASPSLSDHCATNTSQSILVHDNKSINNFHSSKNKIEGFGYSISSSMHDSAKLNQQSAISLSELLSEKTEQFVDGISKAADKIKNCIPDHLKSHISGISTKFSLSDTIPSYTDAKSKYGLYIPHQYASRDYHSLSGAPPKNHSVLDLNKRIRFSTLNTVDQVETAIDKQTSKETFHYPSELKNLQSFSTDEDASIYLLINMIESFLEQHTMSRIPDNKIIDFVNRCLQHPYPNYIVPILFSKLSSIQDEMTNQFLFISPATTWKSKKNVLILLSHLIDLKLNKNSQLCDDMKNQCRKLSSKCLNDLMKSNHNLLDSINQLFYQLELPSLYDQYQSRSTLDNDFSFLCDEPYSKPYEDSTSHKNDSIDVSIINSQSNFPRKNYNDSNSKNCSSSKFFSFVNWSSGNDYSNEHFHEPNERRHDSNEHFQEPNERRHDSNEHFQEPNERRHDFNEHLQEPNERRHDSNEHFQEPNERRHDSNEHHHEYSLPLDLGYSFDLSRKCSDSSQDIKENQSDINHENVQLLPIYDPLVYSKEPSLLDFAQPVKIEFSDITNATICRILNREDKPVESLVFTDNGLWLSVGRTNGQIDIYDTRSMTLKISFPGGLNKSVRCMKFIKKIGYSDDFVSLLSYRLISCGLHGVITEWDLSTQSVKREIQSYGGAIFACDYCRNNKMLITAADDGGIRLYNLINDLKTEINDQEIDFEKTNDEILELKTCLAKHNGRLLCLYIYDDYRLFAGTADSRIIGWNYRTGLFLDTDMSLEKTKPKIEIDLIPDLKKGKIKSNESECFVWALSGLPEDNILISGDSNGYLCIWDIGTSTIIRVFQPHQLDILCITKSTFPYTQFYTAGVDGKVCILVNSKVKNNASSNDWRISLAHGQHDSDITAMASSNLGYLIAGCADGQISYLKIHGNTLIKFILQSRSRSITSNWIQYVPESKIVLATLQNYVELWYIPSGFNLPLNKSTSEEPIYLAKISLKDPENQNWNFIRCSSISPDASFIAVSNNSGTSIFSFNMKKLAIESLNIKKLNSLVATVLIFDFYDSCQYLLLGCLKNNETKSNKWKKPFLSIWDLKANQFSGHIQDLNYALASIIISPDRRYICLRSFFGTCSIYHYKSLKTLVQINSIPLENQTLMNSIHTEAIGNAVFSPDSKYIAFFSVIPNIFSILSLDYLTYLTINAISPKGALITSQENVFKISQLQFLRSEDIGNIYWLNNKQYRHDSDENENKSFHTENTNLFIIHTDSTILTLRFRIHTETNKNSVELESSIRKFDTKEPKSNAMSPNHYSNKESKAIKKYIVKHDLEILKAFIVKSINTNEDKNKLDMNTETSLFNVILCVQPRKPLPEVLPVTPYKKRYGT